MRPSTPSRCTRWPTPGGCAGTFAIGCAYLCNPAGGADPYTVIICGGGPTGVETAGALAELFGALREQGRLDGEATVHLVDHGQALLRPFTEKSHEYARRS